MAQNGFAKVLLQISFDNNSGNSTKKGIDELDARLKNLEASNKSLSTQATAAGKSLRESLGKGFSEVSTLADRLGTTLEKNNKALDTSKKKTQEAAKENDKLRESLEKVPVRETKGGIRDNLGLASTGLQGVASVVRNSNSKVGEGLANVGDVLGAAENVSRFVDEIGALGDKLQNAGGLVGKLANAGAGLAGILPGVSASFGALLAVAVPLVAIIGALTLAGNAYLGSVQEQSIKLASLSRVQKEFFDTLVSGTTQEAQLKLKGAQDELKSLELQKQNLRSKIDAEFAAQQSGSLGDFGARIRTGVRDIFDGSWKEAKESLGNLDKQVVDAKTKIDLYTEGINSNSFAANDAAEAQKKLVSSQVAELTRRGQAELNYANLAKNASSQQIQDRLAQIEIEKKAAQDQLVGLSALDQTNTDVKKSTEEATQKLLALSDESSHLKTETLALVQAREAEIKAVQGIKNEIQQQTQLSSLIRTASVDQAKDRLSAIAEERDAIQKYLPELEKQAESSKEAAKALAEYRAHLNDLTEEEANIKEKVLPATEAREREKKALDDAKKAADDYGKSLEKTADLQKKLKDNQTEFDQETTRISEERRRSDLREEADYLRKRQNEISEFYQSQSQADADFYADRAQKIDDFEQQSKLETGKELTQELKDIRDHNQESLQLAQQHKDKLTEIQAQTNLSVQKAASKLDASSVFDALTNGIAQTDSENSTFTREKAQRDQDFSIKLQDMREQANQERNLRAAQFQQQLASELQKYQTQRARDEQAFKAKLSLEDQERSITLKRQIEDREIQDKIRQAAFRQQQEALRAQLAAEVRARNQAGQVIVQGVASQMGAVTRIFGTALQSIMTYAQALTSRTASTATVYGNRPSRFFAEGGRPGTGEAVWVGEQGKELAIFDRPATILPSYISRQVSGGNINQISSTENNVNAPINLGDIGHRSNQEVQDMIRAGLYKVLKGK